MVDDLRAAAEMALEALEDSMYPQKKQFDAIIELRQALAQPEQEPVAWLVSDAQGRYATIRDPSQYGEEVYEPLYAAPPSKPWVSLTDEEIEIIVDLNTTDDAGFDIFCYGHGVARAIETKLKEKNT